MPVFVLVPIIAGAYSILLAVYDLRRGRRVEGWPTAPGWLVQADVGSEGFGGEGRIIDTLHYRYSVGGRMYDGNRLSLQRFKDLRSAEKAIYRVREQKQVLVHYDASDPAQSVLLTGSGDLPVLSLVIGVVLVLVGLAAWLYLPA